MPDEPTTVEVWNQILEQNASDLHAVDVGVVVNAWNRTEQTATVQPIIFTREGASRGPVANVPVIFPGVSWDIQIGEAGLLLFGDLNPRRWWRTGQGSRPEGSAMHAVANAVFLPGLRSLPDARNVPVNSAVVDKPVGGGFVRLGDPLAFKAVVHEDLLGDLKTFLVALDTWGKTAHANWAAASISWTATVTPTITPLTVGITGGGYQSPSVYVED